MRIYLSIQLILVILTAGIASAEETVIHNINAYTSTNTGIQEFNVLVISEGGRIAATGGPELLARYPTARQIDGQGRSVLPGLSDAHAHMYGLGFLNISLNLLGTASIDDAVRQIAEYAENNPHADWIQGRGWNQVIWPEKSFPSAADIDAVVADRPVWLRRVDGHAAWANSAALRIAGINDQTADPIGGKIIRDENGHATGVLIDKAMNLVSTHLPAADKDDVRAAYLAATEVLLPLGVTSVHDTGIDIAQAEVYMAMADDDELKLRIYAMLSNAGANLDAIAKPIVAYGNDHLDIRAVKIYADGALGSRGAAMLAPYSDDVENYGLPFLSSDELFESVDKANSMGFQVGVHAIGDRGNRIVLDAFERAQKSKPSALRNRVEHAQVIALDDIPRFARARCDRIHAACACHQRYEHGGGSYRCRTYQGCLRMAQAS